MDENKKESISWDICSIIGTIFFIILFFIIILQVFSREVAYFFYMINFPISIKPPLWTEEGARWAWIWMVYIMWGYLEKTDSHLKAGFLDSFAEKRWLKIIKLIIDVLFFGLLVFLFVRGIIQTKNGLSSTPITLPFVDAALYIVMPISFLFVIPIVVKRILKQLKDIKLFSVEGRL